MEVSAVRSAVLDDRYFSSTESSGSKGPLWSPARTIERSQEGIRGGLWGFNLLAPLRNLTMRSCFPRDLHPQRTIAHPPMPRSTSDPLSACWMKRWARRETAQQNYRGATQNSCCGRSERSVGTGPAESSHCNPQIAQSTSRWFSARGREASAGSDRGSPSHPREEREARSQRCHGYTLRTNA